MADSDDAQRLARIQEVVTALIERRIAISLGDLDASLAAWRKGEIGALEAHDAVVRHANHAEGLVKRVMAAAAHPDGVMRDAFDAGVISAEDVREITGREPDAIDPANSLADPVLPPPDKRTVVDDLLSRGPVLVHFDARRGDVQVPPRFVREAKLVLRFGHALSPPIPDLVVDEKGIAGTLTFGGVPFRCVLPWVAIFAAVQDGDQRGMVWPDDIPDDLIDAAGAASVTPGSGDPARRDPTPVPPPSRSKRPSHLKLVD
jgi:stringent starvation protein B